VCQNVSCELGKMKTLLCQIWHSNLSQCKVNEIKIVICLVLETFNSNLQFRTHQKWGRNWKVHHNKLIWLLWLIYTFTVYFWSTFKDWHKQGKYLKIRHNTLRVCLKAKCQKVSKYFNKDRLYSEQKSVYCWLILFYFFRWTKLSSAAITLSINFSLGL